MDDINDPIIIVIVIRRKSRFVNDEVPFMIDLLWRSGSDKIVCDDCDCGGGGEDDIKKNCSIEWTILLASSMSSVLYNFWR